MANVNSLRKLSDNNKTEVKRGNKYSLNPRLIQIEPGHNARGAFMEGNEYWEQEHVINHIEGFCKSYTDGVFVPPIVVQVIDGVPYVRDGEHRLRGAMLAIERDNIPLEAVDVVESSGDELAQTLTLLHGNSGLEWSPVERAVIYGRMKSYGFSVAKIAETVNKTVAHVHQQLTILDMPIELKRIIQSGGVSCSVAIELFNLHGGAKTIDMILNVTGKATKSKLVKRIPAKTIKHVSSVFCNLIPARTGDNYVITMTPEQFEEFNALQQELNSHV